MMSTFQPPTSFNPTTNPAEEWQRWKKKFMVYYGAAEIAEKTETIQRDILLYVMGDLGQDLVENLNITEPAVGKVDAILNAMTEHYKPYKNLVYKRHEFTLMKQSQSETIDQFVMELTRKAKDCEYGTMTEEMIRDRLIAGTRDEKLRQRLLRQGDITLAKAIEISRIDEISQAQWKETMGKQELYDIATKVNRQNTSRWTQNTGRTCGRCDRMHKPRQCPAYGKRCNKCNKLNHYAKLCKNDKWKKTNGRQIGTIQSMNDQLTELSISEISVEQSNEWIEKIYVNKQLCVFKLDTGSDVNVLPMRMYKQLQEKPEIITKRIDIKSYSNHNLKTKGMCKLSCETIIGNKGIYEFVIMETDNKAIIGRDMSEKMGLIKRIHAINKLNEVNQIIAQYKDVFEGMGQLPTTHHITLDTNIVPHVTPARRIPLAIQAKVKQTLKEMEKQNIIEKIDEPTDWVHPMMIKMEKGEKIRICLDPRLMNEGIKRQHVQIPTLETLTAELKDAEIFTVLDAAKAFYQIKLDDYSSKICTFATANGCYKFNRMPFGLRSAPEVFQAMINKILEGIEGVSCYFDDILIYAKTQEQHDERLSQVLKQAHKNNLKFDINKMQLSKSSVTYLGHEIGMGGIRITSQRTKAINELHTPNNRQELKRFLGMVGYLTRFIKGLSSETVYLRQLLKKDTVWIWDAQAEKDFQNIKKLVEQAPTLIHFNPEQQTTITADASRDGMGAAILQEKGPIAYTSAMFTQTQKNYSQIEKEMLAIMYACEKFHYYIYGREVTVETDHKPLINLVNKPLDKLSPRLQRMVVRIQRYNTKLKYVPGNTQYISDTLSRDTTKETEDTTYLEGKEAQIHLLVTASEARLQAIRTANQWDPEMKRLIQYASEGWPRTINKLETAIRKYWPYRDEIHVSEGLLYRGERIMIPRSERQHILTKIHQTHEGIVACKNRAREGIYWPSITKDIENYVNSCKICLMKTRTNRKETLIPHEIPKLPWYKIGMDFMDVRGIDYLVIVDYLSKFVHIETIKNKTAMGVINIIKRISSIHGFPQQIMTDNGPPFDSNEYNEFLKTNEIEKITSSPLYPQSNGMIERTIQTCKKRLIKTLMEGGDHYMVQLNYNATPHNGLESPSEILMGRKIRSNLPITEQALQPKYDIEHTQVQLEINQDKMVKTSREETQLPGLNKGTQVYYKHTAKEWRPGWIIDDEINPRSYRIQTDTGQHYRRNRIHLRPVPNKAVGIEQPVELHMGTADLEKETNRITPTGNGGNDTNIMENLTQDNTEHEKELISARPKRENKPPVWMKDYVQN